VVYLTRRAYAKYHIAFKTHRVDPTLEAPPGIWMAALWGLVLVVDCVWSGF